MSVHLSQKNKAKNNSLTGSSRSAQWAEFFSLIKSLAIFFAIAFMLRASVVEAFRIPSSSMQPTLKIGDHILVNKLSYGLRVPFVDTTLFDFRMPKRGDVVVFTLPDEDDPMKPEVDESETNIIKRVIGLPGDQIQVRGTKLFINGKELDESYAIWVDGGRKSFGPVIIPEGRVLLLGDNRDQSKDSRYWNDPFLSVERIKGRAFIIYWNWPPWNRIFHLIN